jgi:hypothetical protein
MHSDRVRSRHAQSAALEAGVDCLELLTGRSTKATIAGQPGVTPPPGSLEGRTSQTSGSRRTQMASNGSISPAEGWGIWRTRVDPAEKKKYVLELNPSELRILFGVINDGEGIGVTPSGHGVRVPPRQPVRTS